MKLTKDQAESICFGDSSEDGWFKFIQKDEAGSSRWMDHYLYVFKDLSDGSHYGFYRGVGKSENCDSQDIPEDGIECFEVVQKTKMITYFEAKAS
jgi:hypothetical protein